MVQKFHTDIPEDIRITTPHFLSALQITTYTSHTKNKKQKAKTNILKKEITMYSTQDLEKVGKKEEEGKRKKEEGNEI